MAKLERLAIQPLAEIAAHTDKIGMFIIGRTIGVIRLKKDFSGSFEFSNGDHPADFI